LCLLAAIATPAFQKAHRNSQARTCVNNLKIIQGAKTCWALENKKGADDKVDWQDISDYIKPGTRLGCPAGGDYTIGIVGTNASCSVSGHVLPRGLSGCGQ